MRVLKKYYFRLDFAKRINFKLATTNIGVKKNIYAI